MNPLRKLIIAIGQVVVAISMLVLVIILAHAGKLR